MSEFQNMFSDNSDLDQRLDVASQLLKQAADENGVDLSQFSQEELGDMLGSLVNEGGAEQQQGGGEGGGDEGKTAGDLTYADVAYELNKRAAYEGVDLSQLDPEEYNAAFDKVASEMTDPEFAKVAAQEAHMDQLGRIAARGFVDEINKLAADEDKKNDEDEEERQEKKAALKDHAKKLWEGAKHHERTIHGRIGKHFRKKETQTGDLSEYGPRNAQVGRRVTGGTAAAAAAAEGGRRYRNSR